MKNLSIILLVLSLSMIVGHVHGAGVRIANELRFKKLLKMECHSKDDKIGPKILKPGEHFRFLFGADFFGRTRFNCRLSQGPNFRHHQSFVAFKQHVHTDLGGVWDWRAREDGIYFKKEGGLHIKKPTLMRKEYSWIP
ncbi:unnamed protein product [Microthlaspi erraticum]|uniref:S-protein homolog n=1 Tax=Microthlaspi erraticum TaxID=1685480 RepID=A0A6D2J5N7_9BRAS|nr:unnamed protein product [Microthlaspi erraticum]